MRVLGADVAASVATERGGVATLVALDAGGAVASSRQAVTLTDVARIAAEIAEGEPFVLGVNLPIATPPKLKRSRAVDNLVRRRLGVRLGAAGRLARATSAQGAPGESLMRALAAAGHPCLPYPDRDRRRSGLAEIWPSLVLKALLWEGSAAARAAAHQDREGALRSFAAPAYRVADAPRSVWAERAASLDLLLRALAPRDDLDLRHVESALGTAASDREVEWAGGLLDATLIAFTARRYLDEPEACAFVGDRDDGYVILPADGFLRRLALREPSRAGTGRLFPKASLRERLQPHAALRPLELVEIPGRPHRMEAVFETPPAYEFDNVDEMVWWKHCRHLAGPEIPTEGLAEIVVRLGREREEVEAPRALRLVRSRHRVLSFRFDPPSEWRAHVATRDGKTYPFRVLRAIYETRAAV